MREALEGAAAFPLVLVDLGDCELVDSTGLAVLVNVFNARGKSKEEAGGLRGQPSGASRVVGYRPDRQRSRLRESREALGAD